MGWLNFLEPVCSGWRRLLARWRHRHHPVTDCNAGLPDPLWQTVLSRHPYLHERPATQLHHLRRLCARFLADKEFHGTHGLTVTDAMALDVALQACLPLLHWGPDSLRWYDDFVGIVIHPHPVLARRELTDMAGVVHHYTEALSGEAMAGGPLMLVWPDVWGDGSEPGRGHSLVIHEFSHKLDMRHKRHDQDADGCPRLPLGWLGLSPSDATAHWRATLTESHAQFVRAVALAERFGAEPPWLDAYAATSMAEFFAVCCEAYFVNRPRFATEFPELLPLFDAFFVPPAINDAAAP